VQKKAIPKFKDNNKRTVTDKPAPNQMQRRERDNNEEEEEEEEKEEEKLYHDETTTTTTSIHQHLFITINGIIAVI
jgi:hypothetical protein